MKAVARLVAVVGAVAVGAFLFSERARDVALVYDVGAVPGARAVAFELRRGSEVLRRGELTVPAGAAQVTHAVRLPAGTYELAWRLSSASPELAGERVLEITDEGTIVLALGR